MKRMLISETYDENIWKTIIGKTFLCENGLILYAREVDGIGVLEIIGKLNDDINNFTYDDIIETFYEPKNAKKWDDCWIEEYTPTEQILSKRFSYENESYWFFGEGELIL